MNAIMGMTAIATANIDNPDQVRECLRKITLSSKHLLGLINDVLDMSKIESGRLSLNLDVLSLREAMESIVSIAQPQVRIKRQSFDVYIHDIRAERVYCDGRAPQPSASESAVQRAQIYARRRKRQRVPCAGGFAAGRCLCAHAFLGARQRHRYVQGVPETHFRLF